MSGVDAPSTPAINAHTVITVCFVWGVFDSCRGLLRPQLGGGAGAGQRGQLPCVAGRGITVGASDSTLGGGAAQHGGDSAGGTALLHGAQTHANYGAAVPPNYQCTRTYRIFGGCAREQVAVLTSSGLAGPPDSRE
jgi:hypothetical protein